MSRSPKRCGPTWVRCSAATPGPVEVGCRSPRRRPPGSLRSPKSINGERVIRRVFPPEYKLSVLAEYERCSESGDPRVWAAGATGPIVQSAHRRRVDEIVEVLNRDEFCDQAPSQVWADSARRRPLPGLPRCRPCTGSCEPATRSANGAAKPATPPTSNPNSSPTVRTRCGPGTSPASPAPTSGPGSTSYVILDVWSRSPSAGSSPHANPTASPTTSSPSAPAPKASSPNNSHSINPPEPDLSHTP